MPRLPASGVLRQQSYSPVRPTRIFPRLLRGSPLTEPSPPVMPVEEVIHVLDVDAAFQVAGPVRKAAYGREDPQVASTLIGTTT